MSLNVIILAVAVLALVTALMAITFNVRFKRFLSQIFTEVGHERFGDVLLSHQRQLRRDQESLRIINQRLERLETSANFLLNQVGLVRYNPFSDGGGNMSFSLALLNNNGDGAVVTSLHSRDGVRVYAKNIRAYKSNQILTDEEQQAIEQAKRNNN